MYSSVFDSQTNELFLMKFEYAYSVVDGTQNDFTLTYTAQKIDSYCGPSGSGSCTIYGTAFITNGAYEGNENQEFLFYAGKK